jgi:transposase
LVLRQNSTGGKERLGSISRQGIVICDAYSCAVRYPSLGAHAPDLTSIPRLYSGWATTKLVAAILANKMARIAWAVLAKAESYRASHATAL